MVTKSAASEVDELRTEINDVREQMARIEALLQQQASKPSPESEDETFHESGLADATERLREYLEGLGLRTDVIDRINEDIHQHPLRNLAIAAGIGWVIGRLSGGRS